MSHQSHRHDHEYLSDDQDIAKNEKKTLFVVVLTTVMMLVEVSAGYLTSSMALLADGWHMASHAGALAISLLAYKLAKSERLSQKLSFGAGKFIPLGGYTSALVLAIIAILMIVQSVDRLLAPVSIQFNEAIIVAVLGLVVNVVCAFILFDKHHHHHGNHTHDHSLKSAYIHVIADALTSVLAIVALVIGKYSNAVWLDAAMGIVGSAVILRWAYSLCKETVWELLDGHAKAINRDEIAGHIEQSGAEVSDLHVWRITPKAHACEMVIVTGELRGVNYYKSLIREKYDFSHLIVEEQICQHGTH